MRAALYLVATLVLIPYLLLAAAFVLLGSAIAAGTLAGFLAALLRFALWLMPWGALAGIAALCGLAALGLVERTRRLGALVLSALPGACLVIIAFGDGRGFDAGAALFLTPCALVALSAAWLALSDRRPGLS